MAFIYFSFLLLLFDEVMQFSLRNLFLFEAVGTVVGLSIPSSSLFSQFFIEQLYSMLSRSHYLECYLWIIIQIQWFLGENVESSLYPSVLVYYIFFTISNSFFIVFRKILKYYVKVIFPYNFK